MTAAAAAAGNQLHGSSNDWSSYAVVQVVDNARTSKVRLHEPHTLRL